MTLRQKGFITVGALITFLLAMPFASTIWMKVMAAPTIYETIESVPASELAVVLGAAAYNSHRVSPILQDRLDTALDLWSQKKVTKLFLTGSKNEVEAMKNYVKDRLPADSTIEDPKGVNTLASIQNIPKTYRYIILVTQRYHLPRAIFYAEHLGFNAVGLAADRREYARIFDFKKRELFAASKAALDVWLNIGR